MNINEIIKQIKDMSYEDKSQIFNTCFNLGYLGDHIDIRFPLIGLIALSSKQLQKKNPKFENTYKVLKIITKDTNHSDESLQTLGLFVDALSYGVTSYNTYKLKDHKEILNKINELLSTWTPF